MDRLISDALTFLKQEALLKETILVTPEEFDHFSPQKKAAPLEKKPEIIDPEMRQLISKILPQIHLTTEIPSDQEAKHRSHLWKHEFLKAKVLVLCTAPSQFFHNLTQAIHTRLAPGQLVEIGPMEKEGKWEIALTSPLLKLVLAPPLEEWKSGSLARFYKETPASQATFLGNIPLILMQPASAYQNNPNLKKELWKTLASLLSMST